jgi:hypothetical protein
LRRYSSAHAPQVVETFINLIKSGPATNNGIVMHWHRWESAQRLGEMGEAAKDALPVLREPEGDTDEDVRKTASAARMKIEKALVPPQEKELNRPESR